MESKKLFMFGENSSKQKILICMFYFNEQIKEIISNTLILYYIG